jgi:iron complex outermembrane receptor protein
MTSLIRASALRGRNSLRTLIGAAILAPAIPLPISAADAPSEANLVAQTTPAPTNASETSTGTSSQLDEVVVTGSRIARRAADSPTPITIMDSSEMQKLGITSVGDALAQLPQDSPFVSPANIGIGGFNIGASLANLRGLNPFYGTRTLTLVDGERFVPSTNGGAVDLTLIPSNLVARVETVTGGASAAYGSDAVAGVVNVILDTKLNGFKFQADGGATSHGDGADKHVSAAWGSPLLDGRAHFIIGGEYEHAGEIGNCSDVRSWCREGYDVYTNAPGAEPNYVIGPGARSPNETITGVFPYLQPFAPTLANTQFNPAGTALVPFNPGNYDNAPINYLFANPVQGGDSNISPYQVVSIRPVITHFTGLMRLSYNITDSTQAFVEFSYGRRYANSAQESLGPTLEPIYSNNAYLPAAVAGQIPADGFAFFNASVLDYVRHESHTNDDTFRGVTGLNGDFSEKWHWDAYYQYGQNRQDESLDHVVVNGADGVYNFLGWALNAVTNPANGQIVCAATLPGNAAYNPLAAGCVPMNLFGSNNASAAAIAYAYRTEVEDFVYQQHVISGNVHGDLFAGWGAGPIGLAAGLEFREEAGHVSHNLADTPWYNDFGVSYGLDFAGDIKVGEAYTEVNVPVLKNLPFAKSLDIDAAIRETRNESTDNESGDSKSLDINTWKVSLVWDPLDWLRFRADRSKDVRAAGFRDLFQRTAPVDGGIFGNVVNPQTGATITPLISGGGNFGLSPEEATTTSFGVVFQPSIAEGLLFSADWYNVSIDDAITTPTATQIVNDCFQFGTLCERVNDGVNPFPSGSAITAVNTQEINLSNFTTRGMDYEGDYRVSIGDYGNLSFRVIASWLYDFLVNGVNYAGQTGPIASFNDFNTSPKWQGNTFVTWSKGPWSGTVQLRVIGSGIYNATYTGPDSPNYAAILANPAAYPTAITINNNRVSSATYLNLAGSYDIWTHGDQSVQLFASINNVLNKDPPVAPGGNLMPTNPVYFDTYGLAWKFGVRAKF